MSRQLSCDSSRSCASPMKTPLQHSEDLHNLVAEVTNDLDRNAARLGWVEGARGVAVQR